VFAEVGIKVKTRKIARLAERMGIRTPVSNNFAISLGGLKQGVTPLDLAHAYETLAEHGERVTGTLGASNDGPVGLKKVEVDRGGKRKVLDENSPRYKRVLPQGVADTTTGILKGVVLYGTGRAANLGDAVVAGKTGTTENYGDAWFVGFTEKYTVAIWVGYPEGLKPMKTEYRGKPVAGGTYPAEIFHDFMTSILSIDKTRADAKAAADALKNGDPVPTGTGTVPDVPVPSNTTTTPSTTTPQDKAKPKTKTKKAPTQDQTQPPVDTNPPADTTPTTPNPTTPSDGGGASPPPGT
jgi:penicillin-binding protein 1A